MIKHNQGKAAGFPRAPAQLAGARGKIYLKIIFFFHAWAIFNWIFELLDSKNWFCKFFNFLHFCAGCKKNCYKPFGIQILIFIWSNHWPRLPRKWTTRIFHYDCYFYAKFAKNTSKLHISVKPKILPEGRYKTKAEGECFAPLFKIYFKIMIFFHAWAIFNWIFTSWMQKIDFAKFSTFWHFRARCKKICSKPFGIQILIFIWSNHWPKLPRKWYTRICHYDYYF